MRRLETRKNPRFSVRYQFVRCTIDFGMRLATNDKSDI